LITSCSEKKENSINSDGSFEVDIIHEAGEAYIEILDQDTLEYLHYPFAVGEFSDLVGDHVSCIAIGKNLHNWE